MDSPFRTGGPGISPRTLGRPTGMRAPGRERESCRPAPPARPGSLFGKVRRRRVGDHGNWAAHGGRGQDRSGTRNCQRFTERDNARMRHRNRPARPRRPWLDMMLYPVIARRQVRQPERLHEIPDRAPVAFPPAAIGRGSSRRPSRAQLGSLCKRLRSSPWASSPRSWQP